MMAIRQILPDARAATAVEFALLAPIFFLLLFGVIEGSRLAWTRQTLDEVAYSTARCMSVSASCEGGSASQDYAVERASGYGVTVAVADVTGEAGITCRGFPNSTRVTITHSFNSVMDGFVPVFPAQIMVESCFPVLS